MKRLMQIMILVASIGMCGGQAFGWGCGYFPFVQFDEYTQKYVDRYTDMMTVMFDTNGDFKNDVVHVYKILGYGSAAGTNAYPVIADTPYIVAVDTDYVGGFDELYIDTTGTGTCGSFHRMNGEKFEKPTA